MARRLQYAYLFNRTITYDPSIMPRSADFPVDTVAGRRIHFSHILSKYTEQLSGKIRAHDPLPPMDGFEHGRDIERIGFAGRCADVSRNQSRNIPGKFRRIRHGDQ